MPDIGIIGGGIAALTLALHLQQDGIATVLHPERDAGGWAHVGLPNTVARYGPTVTAERELGVDHWRGVEVGLEQFELSVLGAPVAFSAPLPQGGSAVDFRLYLPQLLQDYASRGGTIVHATTGVPDARVIAERHDLVVVATGRPHPLFPRDPDRSTHAVSQRRLCAAIWGGIDPTAPPGITAAASPGAGEVFSFPFLSRHGPRTAVLVEAVPGGPLDTLAEHRHDLETFGKRTLRILEEHAPGIAARVRGRRVPGARTAGCRRRRDHPDRAPRLVPARR